MGGTYEYGVPKLGGFTGPINNMVRHREEYALFV